MAAASPSTSLVTHWSDNGPGGDRRKPPIEQDAHHAWPGSLSAGTLAVAVRWERGGGGLKGPAQRGCYIDNSPQFHLLLSATRREPGSLPSVLSPFVPAVPALLEQLTRKFTMAHYSRIGQGPCIPNTNIDYTTSAGQATYLPSGATAPTAQAYQDGYLYNANTSYSNGAYQPPPPPFGDAGPGSTIPPASNQSPRQHDQRKGSSASRKSSIFRSPWEHEMKEKHLHHVPTSSDTIRYFDRARQTCRVFLECLYLWFGTVVVCTGIFGVLYGFSTFRFGLSQTHKYTLNALITGLSILLGLAFAAQFKQYAEMMRWRFLSARYRTLGHFEDVLDCDSYRSTLRIIFTHHRPGSWLPTKEQVFAALWFLVFVTFNVFAALIGLTYSIDVSVDYVRLVPGNVSVANLKYISSTEQPDNGQDYRYQYQRAAANLWGQVGANFPAYYTTYDDIWSVSGGIVFTTRAEDQYWNRFVDTNPDHQATNVVSVRTVTSVAVCEEYTITFGGYAGFNTDDPTLVNILQYIDTQGNTHSDYVPGTATGSTTWMGDTASSCGPRCTQLLALQSANNYTVATAPDDVIPVPKPRLWACNNTVSQVANYDYAWEGFQQPDLLTLPDPQAAILAGAIGWTGINTTDTSFQFVTYAGDTYYSPSGDVTGRDIAGLVMKFTAGALSAMDAFGGPRLNLTGLRSPNQAQVVNVKWVNAGAILTGIPVVQFIMLVGVVWFSGKAMILEPSYLKIAHLLRPTLSHLGEGGSLLSANEIAEPLGPNFKIAYGVKPDPADPGYHDKTFVRQVAIIPEHDGFGKLTRGKMPTGRYD
ncbi:hypothetical protein DV737_g2559, partial [Chaetothyriales sp. CBS 132003]